MENFLQQQQQTSSTSNQISNNSRPPPIAGFGVVPRSHHFHHITPLPHRQSSTPNLTTTSSINPSNNDNSNSLHHHHHHSKRKSQDLFEEDDAERKARVKETLGEWDIPIDNNGTVLKTDYKPNSRRFTKITCFHASVAQKSYGSEKRFLCPPPLVLVSSPYFSTSTASSSITSTSSQPPPPSVTTSTSHPSSSLSPPATSSLSPSQPPPVTSFEAQPASSNNSGPATIVHPTPDERDSSERSQVLDPTQPRLSMSVVSESGEVQPAHSPFILAGVGSNGKVKRGLREERGNDSISSLFKTLHISNAAKTKSFKLLFSIHSPSVSDPIPPVPKRRKTISSSDVSELSSSSHSQAPSVGTTMVKPFASFSSQPIAIISKPSKKTYKARSTSSCIFEGGSICLFNRINSQTVRTKFMSVENDPSSSNPNGELKVAARSSAWTALRVDIVKRVGRRRGGGGVEQEGDEEDEEDEVNQDGTDHSELPLSFLSSSAAQSTSPPPSSANPSKPRPPRTVTYGSVITLSDPLTNYTSPPMIVRQVNKTKVSGVGEDFGGPVSQMQKLAFQRVEEVEGREGGRWYWSAVTESREGERSRGYKMPNGSGGEEADGNLAPPQIGGVGTSGNDKPWLTWQRAKKVESDGTDEVDDFLSWTVVGISSFSYTLFDSYLPSSTPIEAFTLPLQCISPVPRISHVPKYNPSWHSLEIVISDFLYSDPTTSRSLAFEIFLGPFGPLKTKIVRAPQSSTGALIYSGLEIDPQTALSALSPLIRRDFDGGKGGKDKENKEDQEGKKFLVSDLKIQIISSSESKQTSVDLDAAATSAIMLKNQATETTVSVELPSPQAMSRMLRNGGKGRRVFPLSLVRNDGIGFVSDHWVSVEVGSGGEEWRRGSGWEEGKKRDRSASLGGNGLLPLSNLANGGGSGGKVNGGSVSPLVPTSLPGGSYGQHHHPQLPLPVPHQNHHLSHMHQHQHQHQHQHHTLPTGLSTPPPPAMHHQHQHHLSNFSNQQSQFQPLQSLPPSLPSSPNLMEAQPPGWVNGTTGSNSSQIPTSAPTNHQSFPTLPPPITPNSQSQQVLPLPIPHHHHHHHPPTSQGSAANSWWGSIYNIPTATQNQPHHHHHHHHHHQGVGVGGGMVGGNGGGTSTATATSRTMEV